MKITTSEKYKDKTLKYDTEIHFQKYLFYYIYIYILKCVDNTHIYIIWQDFV